MTTIELSKPLKDNDKSITSVTLREPTGTDVIDCGMPWCFRTDDEGTSTRHVDTKAVGFLISRLTGISMMAVHQMAVPDFMKANNAVIGFFSTGATAAGD